MSKPTLFNKGALIANNCTKATQEELNEIVPLDYIIDWIRRRINIAAPTFFDRILILKSSTGSGKSVALPPTIFKEFYRPREGSIVVTQPRVLTTISIVRDQIAKSGYYPWLKLEENLGWQTSSNRKMVNEGLIYMTLGLFIMQMKMMTDAEIMERYKFIIIDEVHEASIDLAAGIFMLKQLFLRNPGVKSLPFIILTSATFDVKKYVKYFNLHLRNCKKSEDPSVKDCIVEDIDTNLIQVAGFSYNKIIHWPDSKEKGSLIPSAALDKEVKAAKYTEAAAAIAKLIHAAAQDDPPEMADVLVFLPGDKEISDVSKLLRGKAEETGYVLLTITSDSVAKKSIDFINLSIPLGEIPIWPNGRVADFKNIKRRIILSTVVAETGITINTLKYVIDCGYSRNIEFSPFLGTSGLLTKPAAKSRIIQRMGRIGRIAEGHYFPLFKKNTYELFQKEQYSDSEINDVSDLVLLAAAANPQGLISMTAAKSAGMLDIVDPPSFDILSYSFNKLNILGFISISEADSGVFQITEMGRRAILFPRIPHEYLRMLFGAYAWHLSILDAITITAYLTSEVKFQESNKVPIFWNKIYMRGLPSYFTAAARVTPGGKDKTKFIIVERVRLVISDNFLDSLFLLNAVENVIKDSLHAADTINNITRFANECGLSVDAIFDFLQRRDEIIEMILAAGLNPFMGTNLVKIDEAAFIPTITKWKHVFYESMRQSLAFYSSATGKYHSINGWSFDPPESLKVEYTTQPDGTPEIMFKRRANCIIYEPAAKVVIKPDNNKPGQYIFKIDRAAVLDGFVSLDENFAAGK